MTLQKRAVTVEKSEDIYYVVYEDSQFVYFVNDDSVWEIEKKSKDSDQRDRALRSSADVVIDKKTKQVTKSRWF